MSGLRARLAALVDALRDIRYEVQQAEQQWGRIVPDEQWEQVSRKLRKLEEGALHGESLDDCVRMLSPTADALARDFMDDGSPSAPDHFRTVSAAEVKAFARRCLEIAFLRLPERYRAVEDARHRLLIAALTALRSYQYGTAAPDLAREVADAIQQHYAAALEDHDA